MYFLIVQESLKFGGLLRNSAVILQVLYDNFYVLLSFAFHLQKDFYGIHELHFPFCFFLLQTDFDTFHNPPFEVFLCFFLQYPVGIFIYAKKYLIIFLQQGFTQSASIYQNFLTNMKMYLFSLYKILNQFLNIYYYAQAYYQIPF